jgi:SAM-dependent methyltransferase
MTTEYLSAFDAPGSGWADYYAGTPHGNFRYEVYPLFCDVVASLRRPVRILDLGAGPGSLAQLFLEKHRDLCQSFALLDSSKELLAIAQKRLAQYGQAVEYLHRTLADADWSSGLGPFHAVVCNNVPFPAGESLQQFFRSVYSLVDVNGIFLYQYPFSHEPGVSAYDDNSFNRFLKSIDSRILQEMPDSPGQSSAQLDAKKATAAERHRRAVEEAVRQGATFRERWADWAPVEIEEHLRILRALGFRSGCIWRKLNSGAVLALKAPRESGGGDDQPRST